MRGSNNLFDKSKVSAEAIRKALYDIKTLDYEERQLLIDRFADERDFGGISKQEWRETIKKLRQEKKISEVDFKNLKKLIV